VSRVGFLLGLAFCSFFALFCILMGLGAAFYDTEDCSRSEYALSGSYTVQSQVIPPGTLCVYDTPERSPQAVFVPVAPETWIWFVCCVAVGALPLTLLFRYKDAQDAKRGGPSF
jgi:hypothetical protein